MTSVPHSNLDAEAAVISACMLSRHAADECAVILDHSDFYSIANQTIFRTLVDMLGADQHIDVVSLAQVLKLRGLMEQVGGSEYLVKITDETPAVAHAGEHAKIVKDMARIRRTVNTLKCLSAEASGAIGEPAEWIQHVESDVYAVTVGNGTQEDRGMLNADLVPIAHTVMKDVRERGYLGVPCGFNKLNLHIGGLVAGDLNVVAGRPGMGKTAITMQMLQYASQFKADGNPIACIMFSLEMPREQLMQRNFARQAEIPLKRIRTGHLDKSEWQYLASAMDTLSKFPIYTDDQAPLTTSRIRSRVRLGMNRIRKRFPKAKLGVVAIDYLQLMTPETEGTRATQIGDMTRSLKLMAKEMDCCVIALSQLNRPAKGEKIRRPSLHDLRDSGSIESDADNVIFVHRPEEYEEDKMKAAAIAGLAEIIVAKGRNSGTGVHEFHFDGRYVKFTENEDGSANDDAA